MQNDGIKKTLLVATGLCILCSVLVSGAAVSLKPRQELNKQLDIKKNILAAAGLLKDPSAPKEKILELYKQIKPVVIELDSGKVVTNIDPETFDQRKARKSKDQSKVIEPSKDLAHIKVRSKYSIVYQVMKNNKVTRLILPINGKGLWSTLYGFIALDTDIKTIKSIGFYQHAETPGLGGEVDNPRWKKTWENKIAYDDNFIPKIRLIKGSVQKSDPEAAYKIDGLSGATMTSNGVTNLVQYWLGQDGFGPYLAQYKQAHGGVDAN